MLSSANYSVKKVLIDTGSSAYILFAEGFNHLRVSRERLRLVTTPLVKFNGSNIKPLGMMELPVLMGTYPQQASTLVNFVVVEALFTDNVILRRSTLNRTKVIVSTSSLIVKFPTPQGVGILWRDQATARYCYINSL